METYKDLPAFYPKTRAEWRKWLQKNHEKVKAVWLVMYKKDSGQKSIEYAEAVEEALCFGWIDSVVNKRDEDSRYQYFTLRKPKGRWSALNKKRVAAMLKRGLMTKTGQDMIDLAKKTGTWDTLTEIDKHTVPPDLQKALNKNKTALKYYEAFPPSARHVILAWIQDAKRPETRQKRIDETVRLAKDNIRAQQPKPKAK
jgi:uncharacterized protein YdeI (YjbR/CyaY-like superfamily)